MVFMLFQKRQVDTAGICILNKFGNMGTYTHNPTFICCMSENYTTVVLE